MADVIKDLRTILNQLDVKTLSLPDSKSWQDQYDRIKAVYKFVNELNEEEDDLK